MPFVRLSIRHVKIMYCVCLSVLEIIPSPQQMESADTLAGAGISNFLNIYVQQTPVNAPHCSVDNSLFCCQVSSVLHVWFLSKLLICRPNLYWPMLIGIMYYRLLKETNFKIALTVQLLSWKAGLKQVNIQNLTICHKL